MGQALILLVGCSGAAAPTSPAPVAERPTVTPVQGEVVERVLLTGELHPALAGAVQLQVPRTDQQVAIRWIAEDGMAVKAGDKLIEFDNSAFTGDLEAKHITAIEADITSRNADELARIALADKAADVEAHQLELAKAKLVAEVPSDLLSAHDAQQHQLDLHRAEVAVEKAKRELESQRKADDLERHVKQIDRDKAKNAVDLAETSIKELVLTAPRDGVFVIGDNPWEGRKFQIGDSAWPGFTMAAMPDTMQALEVHADLSDVDDGRITVGMEGTCTLDAYPAEPVPCKVIELTPVARDKGKKSLRRAFALTLKLGGRDESRQRPGMSVKVELKRPAVKGMVVPRTAIEYLPGGPSGAVKAKLNGNDVELGACDGQQCIVKEASK